MENKNENSYQKGGKISMLSILGFLMVAVFHVFNYVKATYPNGCSYNYSNHIWSNRVVLLVEWDL